jgi:hypothetical protein
MKYKLNINRDVDIVGNEHQTDVILNLPNGFRINDSDIVHVRGFDSVKELKEFIKQGGVIPCNCNNCLSN